jgi:phage-related protein
VDKATNKTRRLYARASLAPLLALAILFWTGTPASGQNQPPQNPPIHPAPPLQVPDNDTTRGELVNMDRFLDSHPEVAEQLRKDPSLINNATWVQQHPALDEFLENHPRVREELKENPNSFMQKENRFDRREDDRDTTRRELANMDRFLDSHREISEQLRKDPSLIDNRQWVANHPQLQEFLQTHPGVREEFKENPNGFMRQEERFDRNDATRTELANMDRFLDSHREISEQLRKDPSLIDNRQWVANHPQLQEFLQTHPGVREEFKENPNAFMRQEERFDRREDARDDHDTTRRQLASMDRFLDNHKEVAEQLRKDPSLIDNHQWVENHPALEQYLRTHPEVREEFKENPNAFMQAEMRYDQREDQRNDRGEMASFGQFLNGHATVAGQLSKDPSLANNKEFLASHPELGEYLKTHPGVTQQLAANPQAVMSASSMTQASGMTTTKATITPKVKVDPNR